MRLVTKASAMVAVLALVAAAGHVSARNSAQLISAPDGPVRRGVGNAMITEPGSNHLEARAGGDSLADEMPPLAARSLESPLPIERRADPNIPPRRGDPHSHHRADPNRPYPPHRGHRHSHHHQRGPAPQALAAPRRERQEATMVYAPRDSARRDSARVAQPMTETKRPHRARRARAHYAVPNGAVRPPTIYGSEVPIGSSGDTVYSNHFPFVRHKDDYYDGQYYYYGSKEFRDGFF